MKNTNINGQKIRDGGITVKVEGLNAIELNFVWKWRKKLLLENGVEDAEVTLVLPGLNRSNFESESKL